MEHKTARVAVFIGVSLSALAVLALGAQDKYTVEVPNGLAFSEFKGYEDWQAVGPSQTDAQNVIRLILANPVMIDAYKKGVPGNGKPFPEAGVYPPITNSWPWFTRIFCHALERWPGL